MTVRADPHGEVAAVIVAAGRGARAGSAEGPKQYRPLAGRAVIARTLDRMRAVSTIGRIVVVIHGDDRELLDAACDTTDGMIVVTGGETRQQSVLRGLEALADDAPGFVLIQDGARPFSDGALIGRVIDALDADHGAIAAMPVADTLKRQTEGGIIAETVSRTGLWAAQTPQGFPFAPILAAHRKAERENRFDFTDDAAIAEWAGLPVRLVMGSPDNTKLTWARDIEFAERLMQDNSFPDVRTGTGYDVHAFVPGDAVTLCGVAIPFDRRLSGHSDADAPLHALTDALLATCGEGDIGTHFPPSDPQWKGVASRRFVEHAVGLVRARGGRIANADISVIAEAPKVGPHRAAMVEAIAGMLGIDAARVSIKATTNERMGFVGREEGIAALAAVSVVYPGSLPA